MYSKWLTPEEFCRLYRVHPTTLKYWIKEKVVHSVKLARITRIADPCWPLSAFGSDMVDPECLFLFRPSQVAFLLQITPRYLRKLASNGIIGYGAFGKRKRLYSLAEVRRLLAVRLSGKPLYTKSQEDAVLMEWARGGLPK